MKKVNHTFSPETFLRKALQKEGWGKQTQESVEQLVSVCKNANPDTHTECFKTAPAQASAARPFPHTAVFQHMLLAHRQHLSPARPRLSTWTSW